MIDGNGEPVIGANILEKGTTNGIVTDFDGNYRLQLEGKEAIIVFSFIGMESVERIATPSNAVVDVVMSNSSVQVEDVVVVAYGTRKKGTVTGSVSVVSADKLENLPVANFGQALACGTWMRWKRPATTAIGMNFGSRLDGGGAKLRPKHTHSLLRAATARSRAATVNTSGYRRS